MTDATTPAEAFVQLSHTVEELQDTEASEADAERMLGAIAEVIIAFTNHSELSVEEVCEVLGNEALRRRRGPNHEL